MAEASGSMNCAKKSGDNGRPCLVPLFRVKYLDINPSVTTDAEGQLYRILIQLVEWGPKPKWLREVESKGHLTLSNAFSACKVNAMAGYWILVYVLFVYISIMVNNILMFSEECLPLINPVWSGCINKGITDSNLTARALLMILTSMFIKDTGP